jgi:hypothetical protein
MAGVGGAKPKPPAGRTGVINVRLFSYLSQVFIVKYSAIACIVGLMLMLTLEINLGLMKYFVFFFKASSKLSRKQIGGVLRGNFPI